jgi:hypothetical protein
MELYTLDETFLREHVVDEYVSAIWAERFVKAGDVQVILPVTPERITRLAEGKFLAEKDSDEIMLIESQSIDGGLMTVKGHTAEAFFNQRYISNNTSTNQWV